MHEDCLIGYNDRLFKSGLRKRYHISRFKWLSKKLEKYKCNCRSVMELGCFDAKSIDYFPEQPELYVGYDANWEGGLEEGRKLWKEKNNVYLEFCQAPHDIDTKQKFEISICMETIEHLPLEDVSDYLEILSIITEKYCFITVPNEKGILLFLKYLFKKLTGKKFDAYTMSELFAALVGKMASVERLEFGHKGFDYKDIVKLVRNYFEVVEVNGIPFSGIGTGLNPTIGIVLKTKNCAS